MKPGDLVRIYFPSSVGYYLILKHEHSAYYEGLLLYNNKIERWTHLWLGTSNVEVISEF